MDPEAEIVCGGGGVYFVEQLPGYYDGYYEELIHEESKKPYYSLKGIKYTRSGTKVVFHTMNAEDLIWNCETKADLEKLEFQFENMPDYLADRIKQMISEKKQEFINYLNEERLK
jgi:hypothetical protein